MGGQNRKYRFLHCHIIYFVLKKNRFREAKNKNDIYEHYENDIIHTIPKINTGYMNSIMLHTVPKPTHVTSFSNNRACVNFLKEFE